MHKKKEIDKFKKLRWIVDNDKQKKKKKRESACEEGNGKREGKRRRGTQTVIIMNEIYTWLTDGRIFQ